MCLYCILVSYVLASQSLLFRFTSGPNRNVTLGLVIKLDAVSRLFFVGSCSSSPWLGSNLTEVWRRVFASLAPPNISTTYFWHRSMPSLFLCTSIPRKYCNFPKSLIFNLDYKYTLISEIPFTSLPAMTLSSS